MRNVVLDAWAILAWLGNEDPGAERVDDLWREKSVGNLSLTMNIVNLGEVFYAWVRRSAPGLAERLVGSLRAQMQVVSASDDLVMQAAALKALGGISYADAFAAATALELDAALATGDPELRAFARREPRLRIEWLGAGRGR